jgi:putative membrane protein
VTVWPRSGRTHGDESMHMTAGAWIWMAVWIGALLVMVWMLVADGRSVAPESPAEVLRRRYAAGEISEEELRHARDVLGMGEPR